MNDDIIKLAATAGQATKPAADTPNFRDDLKALAEALDHAEIPRNFHPDTERIAQQLQEGSITFLEAVRRFNKANFGGLLPTSGDSFKP
jgi:hypothetical protein